MATREKTIEVHVQTVATTLAAATKRTQTGTIYIPESGVTFLAVTAEHSYTDDGTSASSQTSVAMGIKLGAVAEDTTTLTDTVTNTGEANAFRWSRDCTAYFVTNWTGTSMTFEANTTVGANTTNNHTVRLLITYSYSDASSTQIKTIRIPLESTVSALTTSYQSIGGASGLPALKGGSTILPEDSVTIRQITVSLYGSDATGATTDYQLDVRTGTDLEEQLLLYRIEAALSTPLATHAIWDITALGLTAAQAFEAQSTGVTARFSWLGGWITVTYEFDPTSAVIWNSVIMPLGGMYAAQQGGAVSTPAHTLSELWIEEPATIVEKQSALCLAGPYQQATIQVRVDPQAAYKAFTNTSGSGPCHFVARCDASGEGGGAGLGLARGRNRIYCRWYAASSNSMFGIGGFLIINYTSGLHADGIGVHNQSRYWPLKYATADSNALGLNPTRTPSITGSYFICGALIRIAHTSNGSQHGSVIISADYASGEGYGNKGEGSEPVMAFARNNPLGAEDHTYEMFGEWSSNWLKPWDGHPDTTLMNIETSRGWRSYVGDAQWAGWWGVWLTYHQAIVQFAGDAINYSGDGSGITVRLVRDSDGERLLTGTTTTGGAYSFDWYDDTENVYVEMRQSSTKVGRSERGLAS